MLLQECLMMAEGWGLSLFPSKFLIKFLTTMRQDYCRVPGSCHFLGLFSNTNHTDWTDYFIHPYHRKHWKGPSQMAIYRDRLKARNHTKFDSKLYKIYGAITDGGVCRSHRKHRKHRSFHFVYRRQAPVSANDVRWKREEVIRDVWCFMDDGWCYSTPSNFLHRWVNTFTSSSQSV